MKTSTIKTSAHRSVLPEFLSTQECKELEFIHKSCGVFGYRPFVLSTTLSHLVATNCAHLIIPILSVRERVKEAVEEYFGREYELFVEFTGLISWTKGANIGWHSDDNRSYLQQRHYSAVCYLNTYEQDFQGGLFHFQDGQPSTITPSIGTLIIYTADERNIHRVDEVTEGERCTLALWFSADRVHDEDEKLIQQILNAVPDLQARPSDEEPGNVLGAVVAKFPSKDVAHHPVAASSVMYKAQNLENEANRLMEGSGIGELRNPYFNTTDDLRIVRLAQMGFSCCFSCTAVDDQHDNPLVLTFKNHEVPYLFSNSVEALQVAMFHQFKIATIKNWSPGFSGQCLANASNGSRFQEGPVTAMRACHACVAPKLNQESMDILADENEVLVSPFKADREVVDNFLDSLQKFQTYASALRSKLLKNFPSWRTSGSLLSYDP